LIVLPKRGILGGSKISRMGLYFRRRLGLGPLSLNFKKSGIGISAGVRGLHAGLVVRPAKTKSAFRNARHLAVADD
jgi:Protein of unknown function (DUF4236)